MMSLAWCIVVFLLLLSALWAGCVMMAGWLLAEAIEEINTVAVKILACIPFLFAFLSFFVSFSLSFFSPMTDIVI